VYLKFRILCLLLKTFYIFIFSQLNFLQLSLEFFLSLPKLWAFRVSMPEKILRQAEVAAKLIRISCHAGLQSY